MAAETKTETQPRPNRDAFAKRYAKRHPDRDFEDKEDRYSVLGEDADRLDQYEESGKALSKTFDNNRWLAAMIQDLRENPDLDPISWMADNGIDINEAMNNEEYRKKISDKVAAFQKKQVDGETANKEREKNFQKSAEALRSLGLSDDENMKVWSDFFTNVIDPALHGVVTADTWKLIQKANNYDADVANAREEGGIQARNEKIQNKLKTPKKQNIPPTLAQGSGSTATPKPQTKKSAAGEFFDGMV